MKNFPWALEKRLTPARFGDTFGSFGFPSNLQRIVEEFFDTELSQRKSGLTGFVPNIDLEETPDSLVVTAELPGIDEKDIEITLERDSLILQGEKRQEKEESIKGRRYIERSYGNFMRTIPLPSLVDREKVEATFKKGVLTVNLHKTAAAKNEGRKISIKS